MQITDTLFRRQFWNKVIRRVEKRMYRMNLLRAERLTLPDFLGIGAQKAGTTWLFANLKRHPGLFLPSSKELHYFTHHFRRASLGAYAEQFRDADGRLKGEISPDYCDLPRERIAFIRKIMPRCKIIFMLRNPVDRAWSQAVMNLVLRRGRELSEVSADRFISYFGRCFSQERGDYLKMLAAWESVFPKEQILTVFFDDIARRPRELLARVFRFLGVDLPEAWAAFPFARVFRPGDLKRGTEPGAYPMFPACREYLENIYRENIARLYERFGGAVGAWRC